MRTHTVYVCFDCVFSQFVMQRCSEGEGGRERDQVLPSHASRPDAGMAVDGQSTPADIRLAVPMIHAAGTAAPVAMIRCAAKRRFASLWCFCITPIYIPFLSIYIYIYIYLYKYMFSHVSPLAAQTRHFKGAHGS